MDIDEPTLVRLGKCNNFKRPRSSHLELKHRSPSKEEIGELLAQLNEYARVQDTPARVEDLEMFTVKGKVETSFRLIPLGPMDARKWSILNLNIEKKIEDFLANNLKRPHEGHALNRRG